MGWINWVPGVGTIANALADPKGRKVSDYICHMDTSLSGTESEAAAILACDKDIGDQLRSFINDYTGGGIGDQYIGVGVSGISSIIAGLVTKRLVAVAASKAAVATSGGVTVALALDAFINLKITLDNLNEMKVAAQQMKDTCCSCEKTRCGDLRAVGTGESITRWFFGAERSFQKTKQAMQEKAKDDYQHACVGDCQTGECQPVAYVTEWDQGGFAMHRTTLTYDVYCECTR